MSKLIRNKTRKSAHNDWLDTVEIDGPFLSIPVLNEYWPNGMDRLEVKSDRLVSLKNAHAVWRKNLAAGSEIWLEKLLREVLDWGDLYLSGTDVPNRLHFPVPEHRSSIFISGALFPPDFSRDDSPLALVLKVPYGQRLDLPMQDNWAASPITRMARALRRNNVEIGLVTDGRFIGLVWASDSATSASGQFDTLNWNEEPLARDAFVSLLEKKRFLGVGEDAKLPSLFRQSLLQQEEITEALGKQVRQAVELLVQSFSENRIREINTTGVDPIPVNEREPYEAAVNLMMRIVFMLFAEERGLLPVEEDLYLNSYALTGQLQNLESVELNDSSTLEASFDVWYRILGASKALFHGATFEDIRMPAYGGSLFDPKRFEWLVSHNDHSQNSIQVSDRVMLEVLRSIQTVTIGSQKRQISFREVDVEQIGYIYEGLLGYTSKFVDTEAVIGLIGKSGDEPEIPFSVLMDIWFETGEDYEAFHKKLEDYLSETQPAASFVKFNQMMKLLDNNISELDLAKLQAVCAGDLDVAKDLSDVFHLIRKDLRGLPYVVPKNGIVVTETRSRKNAGAHYTPRSLAEEVVQHALEPLVYSPGPLQEENREKWQLKSSAEILDLKVVDIAVGSGAFLVAAARFLSDRLVEAWIAEGALPDSIQKPDPDALINELQVYAAREVIARCLYGADINEMAVEMCKLSLWLVSLDPKKPFTFLDDKVLIGNSLLGVTDLEQIRKVHIFPETQAEQLEFFSLNKEIRESIRLRKEIAASPVDDADVHRSASHKKVLLEKSREQTEKLKVIADAIVGYGLDLNGKKGAKLDNRYEALRYELQVAEQKPEKFQEIIAKTDEYLTPIVETDYERWQPLHWALEVPDVMERGGFDAVIGNPPFLVAKSISGSMGTNLREWLVNIWARKSGAADLVVYFVLAAVQLVRTRGSVGLITAKVVSEGSSREVGLDQIVKTSKIFRAIKSKPWPGSAATYFSVVWLSARDLDSGPCYIDNLLVSSINSELVELDDAFARPQPVNSEFRPQVTKGTILLGEGFKVSQDTVDAWRVQGIEKFVKPYVNGSNLGNLQTKGAISFVIDINLFKKDSLEVPNVIWNHLRSTTFIERQKSTILWRRENWWKHAGVPESFYKFVDERKVAIGVPFTSKYAQPVFLPKDHIISSAVVLFLSDSFADFSFLSSTWHHAWVTQFGGRMEGRIRFTLSDIVPITPWPKYTARLEEAGKNYWEQLNSLSQSGNLTLTDIHNQLIINRNKLELQPLIEAKREVDIAVLDSYGWNDISTEQSDFGYLDMPFLGPNSESRTEFIRRLVSLNLKMQN